MAAIDPSESKRTTAVLVYVVLILALQVFLLVVALEAIPTDQESLAWPAAGLSVGLFITTLALARMMRRG